jgi:hypothetical protein
MEKSLSGQKSLFNAGVALANRLPDSGLLLDALMAINFILP